jgi:tetratricopeptide (TPR) repeat protein
MRAFLVLTSAMFAWACAVHAADPCGELTNGYGPYDYRTDKAKLTVVEVNHFTTKVENLQCCLNGPLEADLDYTLRAFPNHHRALLAMERLAANMHTERPPRAHYTVACYYERAIRFRPDDGTTRMLYAAYLAKKGNAAEAIKHMEYIEKNAGPSANLDYNMGLVYADLKQYDKALEHAHRAYQAGFNLPGLRAKLERAGKWRDPVSVGAKLGQGATTAATAGNATVEGRDSAPPAAASSTSANQ